MDSDANGCPTHSLAIFVLEIGCKYTVAMELLLLGYLSTKPRACILIVTWMGHTTPSHNLIKSRPLTLLISATVPYGTRILIKSLKLAKSQLCAEQLIWQVIWQSSFGADGRARRSCWRLFWDVGGYVKCPMISLTVCQASQQMLRPSSRSATLAKPCKIWRHWTLFSVYGWRNVITSQCHWRSTVSA